MKNVINDQKVIQEMCVDIMSAGAIPDAGNIQAYLNIRKDLWDGPDDVSIYSLSINHSRNELGNKVYLVEIQTVPNNERLRGKWPGAAANELAMEKVLRKFLAERRP